MAAVLSRIFGIGQLDLIMDVVQDTFEAALTSWKFAGVPENPSGWLMKVAKNKAINVFKKEGRMLPLPDKGQTEAGFEDAFNELLQPHQLQDSQLRLITMCCMARLSEKNKLIIILQVLCGFGIKEIANALLMKEAAVKKALLRTKAELRETRFQAGHSAADLENHTASIHIILYLMFNEGYKTTRSKEIINHDLCYEAVRLTKLLATIPSPRRESYALLSLMFFNLSRFPARVDANGQILALEEQDRTKWDRILIEEAYYYLDKSSGDNLSKYHLEAIIASVHCAAPSFEATDWHTLAYLYSILETVSPPSLILTLNKLVAKSYIADYKAILPELDALYERRDSKSHYLVAAAKGALYLRNGLPVLAMDEFKTACGGTASAHERAFFVKKIAQCAQVN